MTSPQTHSLRKNLNQLSKVDWASYKDHILLKLKQEKRPTNFYHEENTNWKAIIAVAGRHIPQKRKVTATFSSEAGKLFVRKRSSEKHP